MQKPLRLHVLQFSHFCERARWALQHAGFDFQEISWATGVHKLLALRLHCACSSMPVLEHGDVVIQGSDRILDYCGICGADSVIEERFEARIGPLVRRYLYSGTLFNRTSSMGLFLFEDLADGQQWLGRLLWPVTRSVMVTTMNCSPTLLLHIQAELERELDWFENRLHGKQYLSGDNFGRTDITAASLLAPLARPTQRPIYRHVKLPAELEKKLTEWEERPAIAWAKRVYDQHRYRV
jgi:glutathione S-transferase